MPLVYMIIIIYDLTIMNSIAIISNFIIFIDDIYNDSNLHSEDQDELEIPDGKLLRMFFLQSKY